METQLAELLDLLGHLIDAERVFSYRALRIARGDQTPLAGFDENAYVASAQSEDCSWAELVEEFAHLRRATILLFRHLPDSAWTRTGTASNHPVSVRAMAMVIIGHVVHHTGILCERYLAA